MDGLAHLIPDDQNWRVEIWILGSPDSWQLIKKTQKSGMRLLSYFKSTRNIDQIKNIPFNFQDQTHSCTIERDGKMILWSMKMLGYFYKLSKSPRIISKVEDVSRLFLDKLLPLDSHQVKIDCRRNNLTGVLF